jgi:hypothetical protein
MFWSSYGSKLIGASLLGTDRTAEGTDNWSGIRTEYASGCTFTDNLITGFNRGNTHSFGLISYDSQDNIFENNHVEGTNGIILKGERTVRPTGWKIRKNFIKATLDSGISLYYADEADVSQNIIIASRFGFLGITHAGADGGFSDSRICNNTIYLANPDNNDGGAFGFIKGLGDNDVFNGNVVSNNIVHSCRNVINSIDGTIPDSEFTGAGSFVFKHNNYYNTLGTFAKLADGNLNYAAWQSLGQDSDLVASLTSDPMFNDPDNDDFTLDADSPARLAGRDVMQLLGGAASASINMGAYITSDMSDEIGIRG